TETRIPCRGRSGLRIYSPLFVDPQILARLLALTPEEVAESLRRIEAKGRIGGKKSFPFLREGEYRLLHE
ncbi:MAG: hypothetical protein ACP5SH_27195, partial [Syntrophobacteraceae bacterium]